MFSHFSDNLLVEVHARLESLSLGELSPVALLRAQNAAVADSLKTLSDFISDNPPTDSSQEIYYFKDVYPKFKSLLVYHTEHHDFLTNLPPSDLKSKKKYCQSKLRFIAAFFAKNLMHYDYFRLDGCLLDEIFYTRREPGNLLQPLVSGYAPFLGTGMAELVSLFLAYERLRNEILLLLHSLCGPGPMSATVVDPAGDLHREFRWTGEDIHLIELVHGIHLTGQVNNGDIGIVELFRVVGRFFGVNLRVPKRGFDDLKARKTISRTAFLDTMRAAVLKKMDDDDAYDPRSGVRRNRF